MAIIAFEDHIFLTGLIDAEIFFREMMGLAKFNFRWVMNLLTNFFDLLMNFDHFWWIFLSVIKSLSIYKIITSESIVLERKKINIELDDL